MTITVTTNRNQLQPPAAPRLPSPGVVYSADMLDQFQNSLRLYFNQLDNAFQNLLGPSGARYLNVPYLSVYSTSDQSAAFANTAYQATFDVTDVSNSAAVTSNKLTVEQTGLYRLSIIAHVYSTDSSQRAFTLWLKNKDGEIDYTTSQTTVLAGNNILSLEYFLNLDKNNFVEIWWAVEAITVKLNAVPATTSPFVAPAEPSITAMLTFASSLTT